MIIYTVLLLLSAYPITSIKPMPPALPPAAIIFSKIKVMRIIGMSAKKANPPLVKRIDSERVVIITEIRKATKINKPTIPHS